MPVLTLAEFIERERPPLEEGISFWGHDYGPEGVVFTPWIGGDYDVSRQVVKPFPQGEFLVKFLVPPWVEGEDGVYSTWMLISEAAAALEVFIVEAREQLKPPQAE